MFQKCITATTRWIGFRHTVLTASVGSTIVAIWTVLRHISNGINFDVVGQVGISAQWLHGLHAGAQIGPTNYILKMPLYLLVNLASSVDPKLRLLILALICNIGAFLLLYWLIRKITQLYSTRTPWLADLGMLWLASIAGRVFWTDYANSRNLEIVGGLAAVYFCLKLWRSPSRRGALLLGVVATLTFFADPLQRYNIGLGLIVMSAGAAFWFRHLWYKRGYALAATILIASVGLSMLLAWLVPHVLPLQFLASPQTVHITTLNQFFAALRQTGEATLHLFDVDFMRGGFSPNSVRQLMMAALLAAALYIIVKGARRTARTPQLVLVGLIGMSYLVYMASGYALHPLTERYLVLIPILTILLFTLQPTPTRSIPRLVYSWVMAVGVSALLLVGALVQAAPSRYSLDAPAERLATFAKQHHYRFILASRQLAVPANYFAGYNTTIVPLVCTASGSLKPSNVFYDKAGYAGAFGSGQGTVALVLSSEGVISDPFHCSNGSEQQFGHPTHTFELKGVGTIYEYPADADSLRRLNLVN